MESIYEAIKDNPEACREEGKRLFFDMNRPNEERNFGLKLLDRAVHLRDLEAMYIIGALILDGRLKMVEGDSIETALSLLCMSANRGFALARTCLNRYCSDTYKSKVKTEGNKNVNKPLTGFDGKKIKLKKSGVMTPVDAKLEYVDGVNILTLSANVVFSDGECDMEDPDKFYSAIYDGFRAWAGEYEVFDGQKLVVKVELTAEPRIFDNVFVIPMTRDLNRQTVEIWNKYGTEKIKKRVSNTIGLKRSSAVIGVGKWSVKSRKFIMIQSDGGRFNEYEEIKHVAKHEFGHALGLGDLYKSEVDGLSGVNKGSYREIDSYHISKYDYNLVMCDHHGVISNNDIEMVVLAFSKNRMQNYQPRKLRDKVSEALGKGN